MASENRELLIQTRDLIEHTRREISQLCNDIQGTRETVEHSLRLLSRPKPPAQAGRRSH